MIIFNVYKGDILKANTTGESYEYKSEDKNLMIQDKEGFTVTTFWDCEIKATTKLSLKRTYEYVEVKFM